MIDLFEPHSNLKFGNGHTVPFLEANQNTWMWQVGVSSRYGSRYLQQRPGHWELNSVHWYAQDVLNIEVKQMKDMMKREKKDDERRWNVGAAEQQLTNILSSFLTQSHKADTSHSHPFAGSESSACGEKQLFGRQIPSVAAAAASTQSLLWASAAAAAAETGGQGDI
jgi:hypothetical protein